MKKEFFIECEDGARDPWSRIKSIDGEIVYHAETYQGKTLYLRRRTCLKTALAVAADAGWRVYVPASWKIPEDAKGVKIVRVKGA